MTLTAADVAEIMRLVEQSGFDELNLEIDGTKINLRRGTPAVTTAATKSDARAPAPAPTAAAAAATLRADPDVQDLPAPLLGTFYRAPKPGAPSFVEIGQTVETNTEVCLIEVMKLFTTLKAGVKGTLKQICVKDAAMVEFGDTLFYIEPS